MKPYLSLALPQDALVKAHAIADIANMRDVCTSVSPKSRANGGTITKTNDWPKPTVNKPNLSQDEPLLVIRIYF